MYRFATLHAKKENYQIASDYFDQIYKIRPEESQVLYLAGEAYERMGNLETALERYTSAICEDPMDSLVWLVRGRVLLNMGEAEDALLSLKQATSLSDEWFDAWMLQGKIEIELGYLDEARKSLTYATVLIPDESESWRLLGDVLHNLKDINPSRIAYERALAIDFSDHEARRGKINAHLSAAEIEEALGEYDIALSLKGENFWDLYGKAMVLFDANRVQEGEIILERAEAFVSEDPKVLFCLAGGWGAICEFERAESFYAASCELDPENSKVWCLRGHSLRDAGKFDEAVVCFNRALEIDPEDSESHSGKEICMDILEGRTLPYTCQRPDHDKNINTNSDQQLKEME
jgi:tetratricopeptide (TPR) repeat protein